MRGAPTSALDSYLSTASQVEAGEVLRVSAEPENWQSLGCAAGVWGGAGPRNGRIWTGRGEARLSWGQMQEGWGWGGVGAGVGRGGRKLGWGGPGTTPRADSRLLFSPRGPFGTVGLPPRACLQPQPGAGTHVGHLEPAGPLPQPGRWFCGEGAPMALGRQCLGSSCFQK